MILAAWYNLHYHGLTPAIIMWTVMALIGLLVTGYNWRNAWKDLVVVEQSGRHDLLPVAQSALRREALRLMSLCSILPIAVIAFITKPTLTDYQRQHLHIGYWTPVTLALTFTITMMVGLIVLTALMDTRDRRRRNHAHRD